MGVSESKEDFREKISELLSNDLSSGPESFWQDLINQPKISDELFTHFTSSFIKSVMHKHPQNISCLLSTAKTIICRASDGHLYVQRHLIINSLRITSKILFSVQEQKSLRLDLWASNYAFELLDGLLGLLFTYGFTVSSPSSMSRQELDISRLWTGGLLQETTSSVSVELRENRTETLLCLLACFSSTLYENTINPWVWIACSYELRHGKDLFFSLLNSVLTQKSFFSDIFGEQQEFSALCCQILLIMVNEKLPDAETVRENLEVELAMKSLQKASINLQGSICNKTSLILGNVLVECITKLHDYQHFDWILDNFASIFEKKVKERNSMISGFAVDFLDELLLLFWHLCDKNPLFEQYVCKDTRICPVIELLMVKLQGENREVQLSLYILFKLSANREFSAQFSRKMNNKVGGGELYIDALAIIAYEMAKSKHELAPLVSLMVTVLSNISAYCKYLWVEGSNALCGLFSYFSEDENMLSLVVEVINNRLQYQWNGSIDLVYNLLMNKHLFEKLSGNPTEELNILRIMYTNLLPVIDHLKNFDSIFHHLEECTMVGLFPTPHPLVIRKYTENPDMHKWLTAYIWQLIQFKYERYANFTSALISLY